METMEFLRVVVGGPYVIIGVDQVVEVSSHIIKLTLPRNVKLGKQEEGEGQNGR